MGGVTCREDIASLAPVDRAATGQHSYSRRACAWRRRSSVSVQEDARLERSSVTRTARQPGCLRPRRSLPLETGPAVHADVTISPRGGRRADGRGPDRPAQRGTGCKATARRRRTRARRAQTIHSRSNGARAASPRRQRTTGRHHADTRRRRAAERPRRRHNDRRTGDMCRRPRGQARRRQGQAERCRRAQPAAAAWRPEGPRRRVGMRTAARPP